MNSLTGGAAFFSNSRSAVTERHEERQATSENQPGKYRRKRRHDSPLNILPSIYFDHLAGDVPGLVRRQEGNQVGQILRLPHAL